jgi:anti-sigma factor RsiW
MTELGQNVSEDELQAYVDNQLDPGRRGALDRYLSQHPDEANRIATYKRQRAALRTAIRRSSSEQVPAKIGIARVAERLVHQRVRWQIAAALGAGVVLGATGDWLLHSHPTTSDRATLAVSVLERQAFASHAVYSVDRQHPIEVSATEQNHLRQWLSSRLNRAFALPDLTRLGYRLLGGRLLATEGGGPSALLMYEDARNHRISVLFRPMSLNLQAPRFDMTQGTVNGCGWIANGLGYGLVGSVPDDELDRIAEQIRTEAESRG